MCLLCIYSFVVRRNVIEPKPRTKKISAMKLPVPKPGSKRPTDGFLGFVITIMINPLYFLGRIFFAINIVHVFNIC